MNTVYHIRRIKSKCHVIVSMGEEKAFDKIQHYLIIKTFKNKGKLLNMIIGIYKKPTAK